MSRLMLMLFSIVVVAQFFGCARLPIAEVGDTAPNFELQTVNSVSSLSLNSSDERPIVLNFWSTSCKACLKELPDLNKIHSEKSAIVIGIALDTDLARVQKVIDEKEINFDIVIGTQQLFAQYDGYGIPYTLVLDKEKTIRKRFRGIASHDDIMKVIEQIEEIDDSVASR